MAARDMTRKPGLLLLGGLLATLTACSAPTPRTPSTPLTPSSGVTTAAVVCPQNLPNALHETNRKTAEPIVPAETVGAASCLYSTLSGGRGSLIRATSLDAAHAVALATVINGDSKPSLDGPYCPNTGRAQVVVFQRPDGSLNRLLLDPTSCSRVLTDTSSVTYALGVDAMAALSLSLGVVPQS